MDRVRVKRPTVNSRRRQIGRSVRSLRDPTALRTRRRLGALTVAAALLVAGACGTSDSADELRGSETTPDPPSPSSDTVSTSVHDNVEPPAAPTLDDDVLGDHVDLTDLSELVESSPIIVRAAIPSEPAEVSDIDGGFSDVGFEAVALRDLTIIEVLKDDPNRYQARLTPRLSTEPGAHRFGMTQAADSDELASLSRSDSLEVLLFLGGVGHADEGLFLSAGGTLGIFLIHDELLEPVASDAAFAAGTPFEDAHRQINAIIEEPAVRTVLEDPPAEIVQQALDMPSAIAPEGWTLRQTGPTTFEFEAPEPPGTVIAAVCATDDPTGRIITDVCDVRDAVAVDVDSAEPVTIEVPTLAEGTARLGTAELLDCAEVQCWLMVASGSDLALRVGRAIHQ